MRGVQGVNVNRIPQELKDRHQWVVWRSVIKPLADGTEKVTKPPYCASDPAREASVTDPTTWSTFDEAMACWIANPSAVAGIGYVFTKDDPYFGIDIDTWRKIKEEFRQLRGEKLNLLFGTVLSYTERSPSGEGFHIICRGRMPIAGKANPRLGIEMYCWNRFFTFTGDVLEDRTEITDQQAFLDEIAWEGAEAAHTDDLFEHRAGGLPDEEVLAKAMTANNTFSGYYYGQTGCGAGEWSDSFMAVVGTLDRITGSVAQIQRIVMTSPMVTQIPPSGSGETRPKKAQRIFLGALSYVRSQNNVSLPMIEHGRQIVERLMATKARRAEEAVEALRIANESVGKLSKGSVSLLDAFPQLVGEHKVLTRPPGVMGEFVQATEQASFLPFTKFAIPAAMSALSGIMGRGYKLPGGSGLNMNFILAAPTATGKTQVMKAWERFINAALEGLPATPAGPPKTRIINSSTSSIQAMMEDFQERPSCVWFVEECHAQLSAMSAGKTPVEAALRDAFNQLYDCGAHGAMFSGPRSVAARKAQLVPVNNLCVSTFWSTVTSKLDVFSDDALDGFLSRVVVIRHSEKGGTPNFDQVTALAPHLLIQLRDRLAAATQIDLAYVSGQTPDKLLTFIGTDGVNALNRQFVETAHAVANGAINGELPPAYTAVSRLPLTAMRMAGVLAVLQSPYAPEVTEEQLKWSFGYLLQNLVSLLSDMDVGHIGGGSKDDVTAVVRMMGTMLKGAKGAAGVPKNDLRERLRQCKPFVTSLGVSPSKMVRDTLVGMLADGQIEEVVLPAHGKGRPVTLICPVATDPVWRK